MANLEVVQTGLGELDSAIIDGKSTLSEVTAEIDAINERLKKLEKMAVIGSPIPDAFACELLNGDQRKTLLRWYPGQWKVLFQASKDGFNVQTFHQKCDNKGATVTVIKSNNGYIFGGYASVSWNGNTWIQDANASLFTLTNPNNIPPTKYVCQDGIHALYSHQTYGPTFGGGHDIHLAHNNNGNFINFPNSYSDTTGYGNNTFTGTGKFTAADYIVFDLQRSL